MSDAHIVVLPKAVWGLKIAQLALSVLILALSAFVVYYGENTGSDFALFSVRTEQRLQPAARHNKFSNISYITGGLHDHHNHILLRLPPRRKGAVQLDRASRTGMPRGGLVALCLGNFGRSSRSR